MVVSGMTFMMLLSLVSCGGAADQASEKSYDGQISNLLDDTDMYSEFESEIEAGKAAETKAALTRVDPGDDGIVRLGFAGDLSLAEGSVTTEKMDSSANGILDCFSPDLVEMMNGFDIFMLNNEFSYSTRGTKSEKTYTFRADPSRVENLKLLGTDIVLTANNHINDYGPEALCDTLDTLEEAGILYVGAGRNLDEARRIVYYDAGDYRISYVAAMRAEEYESTIWTATASDSSPGVLGCYDGYDSEVFLDTISEARANSDFVIACVHWGYEYVDYYAPEHQELCQRRL